MPITSLMLGCGYYLIPPNNTDGGGSAMVGMRRYGLPHISAIMNCTFCIGYTKTTP